MEKRLSQKLEKEELKKPISVELGDDVLDAVSAGTDEKMCTGGSAGGEREVNELLVGDNILISKYSGTEVKSP